MPRLSEESHRFWDLFIKACAAAAFVVPVSVGYLLSIRTADLDAKKPYLEKQLAVCIAAADAAAGVAIAESKDLPAAITTLDRVFWGSLAIFDNRDIATAIAKLKAAAEERPRPDLRPLAEAIAHRCKDLTRASWKIR